MSAVPSSLSARIVAFLALRDFIPLYPLYQLLFTDHGLSASEVSTLFIIWSTTTFVLEVPSGAWADSCASTSTSPCWQGKSVPPPAWCRC